MKTLRTAGDLVRAGLIGPEREPSVARVGGRYAIAIPPALAQLISTADDPIGRQFVPNEAELTATPDEQSDPIGDEALSPIKGIVHRYPDRALLKPLLTCPVYCRFCFRREQVGPSGGVLSEAELEAAYAWLHAHRQIQEVILTGGDPLLLSAQRLRAIIERLSAIPHVQVLRIHSRVPLATPEKVTWPLAKSLATAKAMWLVLHVNHARELTDAAREAVRHFLAAGVPVLGQSVLLAGVNDSEEALAALFRTMIAAHIKPYYLHQLDAAPGTARFRVPIERGRALLRTLRGQLSGLAWPTYVVDIPGGAGKVPIGPDFLVDEETVLDLVGRRRRLAPVTGSS